MAVEAFHPRAAAPDHRPVRGAAARGLAVWLVPEDGVSPEVLAHAAHMVLTRALETAPEAEVHWPAAGATMSRVSAHAEGAAADSSRVPSTAESPGSTADHDGASQAIASLALSAGTSAAKPLGAPAAVQMSNIGIDLAANQVLLDGERVALTDVEFRLLRYLVQHCSRTVEREELRAFLESLHFPGATARSIDVYVGRIRRKFGNARHAIATVRRGGYRFIPGPHATVRGPAEYSI
jgi:two-component system, OmpR family, response regulator